MWRKILIGLVIAIPLAYGGIKLYAAHSISKTADKAITLLAPLADIRYQGTTSSLNGMVGITGVTVHVLKNNQFYRIGAVKIKSDSLFTLLNLDSELEKGKIPRTFGIELDKMTVPVTSEIDEKSQGNVGLLSGFSHTTVSKHCGNRTHFSAADLGQMGITEEAVNMDIEVQRQPQHNDINTKLKVDSKGMSSVYMDMRFATVQGDFSLRNMKHPPELETATMKIRDEGWHKRMQTFCEKQSGMTKNAWLTAYVSDVKENLARHGIGVGKSLLDAYRDFLKDGGTLTLTLAPQSPIDPSSLQLYSIQDVMYYLSPALTVNGKQVDNLDITSIKPVGQESETQTATVEDNYNYKTIPIGSLGRYVGKRVRLTTDNSNVFAGKLDAVSGRIATVDVKDYNETDEEIVLLTRVVKTELATTLKKKAQTTPHQ